MLFEQFGKIGPRWKVRLKKIPPSHLTPETGFEIIPQRSVSSRRILSAQTLRKSAVIVGYKNQKKTQSLDNPIAENTSEQGAQFADHTDGRLHEFNE